MGQFQSTKDASSSRHWRVLRSETKHPETQTQTRDVFVQW